MTAPVLSPVRWWRDDATRYVTRGPQLVPAARYEPMEFPWDLPVLPFDMDMARRLHAMWNAIWKPSVLAGLPEPQP